MTEDAAGRSINEGDIVINSAGRVFQHLEAAHGELSSAGRGFPMILRRGNWVVKSSVPVVYRTEDALLWDASPRLLPAEKRDRLAVYAALFQTSGAKERVGAKVRRNRDKAQDILRQHHDAQNR